MLISIENAKQDGKTDAEIEALHAQALQRLRQAVLHASLNGLAAQKIADILNGNIVATAATLAHFAMAGVPYAVNAVTAEDVAEALRG